MQELFLSRQDLGSEQVLRQGNKQNDEYRIIVWQLSNRMPRQGLKLESFRDDAGSRRLFEQRMEKRRAEEGEPEERKAIRRG